MVNFDELFKQVTYPEGYKGFRRARCPICKKVMSSGSIKSHLKRCGNFVPPDSELTNPFFWVYLRDGSRCQICGRTPNDGIKLHADHIYPVSKGGATDETNLITLCDDCNLTKSDVILPKQQLFSLWEQAIKNCIEPKGSYEDLRREFELKCEAVHKHRSKLSKV